MDMKLEVVVIPVSDVDKARDFYQALGWRLDADVAPAPDYRVVQLTPPGSACSISFTTGVHNMQPGSLEGLQLVVDDADAAREALIQRGVEVGEVQEFPWGRFVFFSDPDGNSWSVQQLPPRP